MGGRRLGSWLILLGAAGYYGTLFLPWWNGSDGTVLGNGVPWMVAPFLVALPSATLLGLRVPGDPTTTFTVAATTLVYVTCVTVAVGIAGVPQRQTPGPMHLSYGGWLGIAALIVLASGTYAELHAMRRGPDARTSTRDARSRRGLALDVALLIVVAGFVATEFIDWVNVYYPTPYQYTGWALFGILGVLSALTLVWQAASLARDRIHWLGPPEIGPVLVLGTALAGGASIAYVLRSDLPTTLRVGGWVAVSLLAAMTVLALLAIWSYRKRQPVSDLPPSVGPATY